MSERKKRKPHQISVRGSTYGKLKVMAEASNKSIAQIVEEWAEQAIGSQPVDSAVAEG